MRMYQLTWKTRHRVTHKTDPLMAGFLGGIIFTATLLLLLGIRSGAITLTEYGL